MNDRHPSGGVGPVQASVTTWILFAASLLATGWDAVCLNHAIQIPLVNWLDNPSLYPLDPFMAVLARYPSTLWPIVALLGRVVPLEGLLIGLFVVERFFVLYAAGRLARAFVPRSGLAVVAAIALFAFAIKPILGAGTIVESYFEQTGLAIAFLLMAAAAFQESRVFAWAIWLAVAFDVNPMYGTFALSYFAAALALDPDRRPTLRIWVRPMLLFLLLASPALFAALSVGSTSPPDSALWFAATRARCWFHFYPMAWSGWRFARFGALLALTFSVLAAVRRERPRLFRLGIGWSIVACLWVIVSFVAAYLVNVPRLLMMQPARATDIVICFAMIAVVAVVAERIESTADPGIRRWWTIALGLSFLQWLPYGWRVVAALLALAALPPLTRSAFRWMSARRLAWLLAVWASLAGVAALHERAADSSLLTSLVTWGPDPSVRRIAGWARAHTPVDAVFLVEPGDNTDFAQFMGLAERSIFTDWERGTALYWAPDYVTEWTERLRALGCDLTRPSALSPQEQLSANFEKLGDDDVALLKQRYRLGYWVAPRAHVSRFPVAFTTSDYQVLDLR